MHAIQDQPSTTLEQASFTKTILPQSIMDLDFTKIRAKLVSEEGQGWSEEKAARVELRYRRFLYLLVTVNDIPVVPTTDIDIFWHQHILDTHAYARDCEAVFGRFVHHNPYYGLFSEDELRERKQNFAVLCRVYEGLFGERYAVLDGVANCDATCSEGCKNGMSNCDATCSEGCKNG